MNTKYVFILIAQVCLLTVSLSNMALADAKVDGFFRENFVSEGHFGASSEVSADHPPRKEKDTFFISREERKMHPEKAPSNNIKLPQHGTRIMTRTIGVPTPWGMQSSTIGTIYSQ